ncbi:hypothetical protein ACFL35_07275 [Candidatus Riflebacteria bacterium]
MPVFLVEYASKRELKNRIRKKAWRERFLLLITDRELQTIGNSMPTGIKR